MKSRAGWAAACHRKENDHTHSRCAAPASILSPEEPIRSRRREAGQPRTSSSSESPYLRKPAAVPRGRLAVDPQGGILCPGSSVRLNDYKGVTCDARNRIRAIEFCLPG
jgi:hypothetical protein